MPSINYCGYDSLKDLNLNVTDIRKDSTPAMTEQVEDIPGMFGVIYNGTSFGATTIEIECLLIVDTDKERTQLIRDISSLIVQTSDGRDYPLILSDDPDVTWWVHPVEFTQPQRVAQGVSDSIITIKFSCSEGVGQGLKQTVNLNALTSTITPIGTAITRPVFTLVTKDPLTKVGISNGEEYVYLGAGFDDESQDSPVDQKPRVMDDDCKTLTKWTKITTPTFLIENGKIASDATFRNTAEAIAIGQKNGKDFFGTNPNGKGKKGWYGAAYQQFLTQSLTDWEVYARVNFNNKSQRAMNKLELYLLDSNGKRIGKLMVKDNDISLENLVAAQIGYESEPGKYRDVFLSTRDGSKITKKSRTKKISVRGKMKTTDSKGKTKVYTTSKTLSTSAMENTFTDFYGYIRLKKQGNKYTATVSELNDKGIEIGKKFTTTYTDTANAFGDKLGGIALFLGKHDITEDTFDTPVAYTPNFMQLAHVSIYGIQGDTKQVVLEAGDEIIIDCENHRVYKNGVSYMSNFLIGSQFFEMKANEVSVFSVYPTPSANNEWQLDYTPRYN
ncbi:hypothetical protein A374_08709 [Fictibacillus macauensis ZFHKF-1]|uniref:Phage tail protein n=1 Tax=Fictibacillus macauensis ZFHKF-1 TaxID=1196324 RepID=I8UGE6_9BACL|nr:phage tail domain-containing protein [Fictibacillus macauensis]EIT85903.1 hypothetical protein A374_08709 [Fictibacillus macauensis ZFHKF-1]